MGRIVVRGLVMGAGALLALGTALIATPEPPEESEGVTSAAAGLVILFAYLVGYPLAAAALVGLAFRARGQLGLAGGLAALLALTAASPFALAGLGAPEGPVFLAAALPAAAAAVLAVRLQ